MKRFKTILLVSLLAVATSFAIQTDKFARIRIYVPDRDALNRIWNTGVDFEGVSGKPGGPMEFVAGPGELAELNRQSIAYQVVVDDLSADYLQRQAAAPKAPEGFGYGSMGGFYTFDEVVRQLDTMALQYPSLVTPRFSIGSSIQGRSLWMVLITSHPNDTMPEVLYTAIHHAREPEGMMSVVYYMWWLLQNYGTNQEATYLVDHRHQFFLPVVNPDGYVYNQTTNPSGGGMWRKNRRNNGDGTFGVDLNRNYGTYDMWNAPNGGSSVSTGSDTYRGTTPFSEPETNAIDAFMRTRQIRTCFNYHTYGNYLVMPWGYLSRESADSLIYRDWTYDMIFTNHFNPGTDQQTVNYSTRGGADDYMFGDTSKPVTYTMTPEVGTTGFWPTAPEIFPLAQANLPQNKLLAHVAGQYTTLVAYTIADTPAGFLNRGTSFTLLLTLKNRGLGAAAGLSAATSASSPSVTVTTPSVSVGSLSPQSTVVVPVSGSIAANAIVGAPFSMFVTITDPEGYRWDDTLELFLGTPTTLLADSANAGTGLWSTGTGWGTTSAAHTPPLAFTDSPAGNYAANADNSLTMLSAADLSGFNYAELRFWAKWVIEPVWDFARVELSTDGGTNWSTLRSALSHSGSGRSTPQASAAWGYESSTPGLTWVEQNIDLSSYVGKQIKVRFRMMADGGDQRDGISVDDIRLYGYSVNADTFPPLTSPVLVQPPDNALSQGLNVVFRWRSMPGADHFRLQVSLDSLFSSTAFDDSSIADTAKLIGLLVEDTTYYWRLVAGGSTGDGPFSAVYRFNTGLFAASMTIEAGWNLVALPLAVEDPHASTLFPAMVNGVFRYATGSGYELRDSLEFGTGYWIRTASSGTLNLEGGRQQILNRPVLEGWNLIGSLSDPIAVGAIGSAPAGIQTGKFFAYASGGYRIVDTLLPGYGYWVKATQGGTLLFNTAQAASAKIRIIADGSLPPPPPEGSGKTIPALPAEYALDQNFPNPFNPTTMIRYALPEEASVRMDVYNVLGEHIATLVEGVKDAGYQSVEWDARSFGSGVYFCRLTAIAARDGSSFSAVQKMLLLR